MRHRLCFLSIILLIILQGLPADLSAQVWEPEEGKTAPAKKPEGKSQAKPTVKSTPSSFANLVVSTDLDVYVFVNGKYKYTVLASDELKSVPLDEGDNFIKVVPLKGGQGEYEEQIVAKERGQNLYLKVDLAAKRQEELRLQEERKRLEEEERRLAPIREIENNMVYVEGGSFRMGCTSEQSDCFDFEKPVHDVYVPGFYLSKHEVTVGQFAAFIKDSGYRTDAEKEGWSYVYTGSSFEKREGVDWRCDERGEVRSQWEQGYPVIHISWNDAEAFCRWLSKKAGKTYRLPSESEWEYAARGGNRSGGYKYAGSNSLDEVGWYGDNSGKKPHKVGEKRANELGLYDMSGNVWEWCQDCWNESYAGAPTNGSAWQSGDCGRRVLLGGSWFDIVSLCRVSIRGWLNPSVRSSDVGFLLAQGR